MTLRIIVLRSLVVLLGATLAACGGGARSLRSGLPAPPVALFEELVEQDPLAAAPLAREVLDSPLTDTTTRARVLQRWQAEVPALEALRDARVADAEALLAQGAVGAAAEVLHEAMELEAALRAPARPRPAADLVRAVETARHQAEVTAAEAGQRARGAFRAGHWAPAEEAAAEARRLRNRAGLPPDVGLAVVEGLARRAAAGPDVVAPPPKSESAPVAAAPTPAAARRTPRRRPSAALAASGAVGEAPPPDPLEGARHARRRNDLPELVRALAAARAGGASGEAVDELERWARLRSSEVVERALASAEAAYVREDLESARAYWDRVLELDPTNDRAREGLALYRRFTSIHAPPRADAAHPPR